MVEYKPSESEEKAVSIGESYTFHLREGDNYISLPTLPPIGERSPADIFGPEVNVWGYDAGEWQVVSAVKCKEGYYAYAPRAKDVTVIGAFCFVTIDDLITIYNNLSEGQYALAGPGNSNITITGTILEGNVLGYNPSTRDFEPVTVLEVGKGYWVGKEEPAHDTALTIDITDAEGNPITGAYVGKTIYIGGELRDIADNVLLAGPLITLYRNGVATELTDTTNESGIYSIPYTVIETDKPTVVFKTVFDGIVGVMIPRLPPRR